MNKADLRRDFFFALGEATQLCRQEMDRRLRPLGLSQSTWRALFRLDRHGEGITQRALAELMGIEGPTLVRLLDSLEREGLVERRPSPADRRANTLHLTAKARPLIKAINRVAEDVRNELLEGLDEQAIRTSLDVLLNVAANITRAKSGLPRTA